VVNAVTIETAAGDNQGKLKITPAAGATKGNSATVTITVNATGQKASLTVTASDAAVPTSIETKKGTTVSNSMVAGSTQTLKFDVKDQYGTVVGATTGYTVDYSTSDSNIVAITGSEIGDALNNAEVTISAVKAGTATVKATLKKDGVAIAEKTINLTVLANDSTKVTYSIPTIAPVYKAVLDSTLAGATINTGDGLDSTEKEAMVKSGYAEEIVVNATDANGNVAKVPTSAIVSVNLTQPKKADGSATTGSLAYFEYNGKYYVYTNNSFVAADFQNGNSSNDLTAKISFTINTDDTVKVVSQDITVSKADAVAQSVEFKDKAWNDANADDAKDVTELTIAASGGYATADGKTAFVWVKDQFGGYTAVSETLDLVNVDGVSNISDDTVTITAGAIAITDTNTDTTFTKNNAKFRLVAQAGSVTDFITFTVADGVAPTMSVQSSTDATNLVLKLSEALAGVTDGADLATDFAHSDTTTPGTVTSAIYDADTLTITLTISGAADGDTISYTGSATDAAGNALATGVVATYDGTTDNKWE
jgi:trimeric autotransporter adhesin